MARTFIADPVTAALGVEIRAEMTAQGLSIMDAATRLAVDRGTLGDWLAARRPMPVPMLVAIATVVRVPTHELVRRAEERARRAR